MGRLTAVAPAGLVPAAWAVTVAAHTGAVGTRTLFVALLVSLSAGDLLFAALDAVGFV